MTLTEKRRSTLINILYFTVLLVAFFLFMKYAFWLFSPFIFAAVVGIVLQKPVNAIHKKTRLRKGFVSVVSVLLLILVLLSLVVLLGYRIFAEFRDFSDFVSAKLNDLPKLIIDIEAWVLNSITMLPDSIEATARDAVSGFADKMLVYAESGESAAGIAELLGFSISDISDKFSSSSLSITDIANPVWSTAKQIPSILISVIIFFVASFFITTDYDNLVGGFKRMLKKDSAAKLSAVKRITFSSVGKMIKSYILIICITFCELAVGLNLLKLFGLYEGGYIIIISACTALLDILPIFGTGTVMIPWLLYHLLFSHNIGLGLGLLVLYVIITVMRQILEPKLVSSNLGIPPVLTLMGMYLGLQTIGVVGMFVIPIMIVLVKMLNNDGIIHLWGEDRKLVTEKDRPAPEPIIRPVVQKITHAVRRNPKIQAVIKRNEGANEQNEDNNNKK